jgi:hypothetical protein
MKTKTLLQLGCFLLVGLQSATAQYITGSWTVLEGSGTTIGNYSPSNYRWDMTLLNGPGLWSYWQPGAYAFANGANNAATALTTAAAWTPGDNLDIKADFNVTGNLHDSGSVFSGGPVFGAGYFNGGNVLGWNYGAFYATVDTANPAAPTIKFEINGKGSWSQALPVSVVDPAINGGWNTAEWFIKNDAVGNVMTLQFLLNGTNVGTAISVPSYYIQDFSNMGGYLGTKFYIGAQADASYNSFRGSIRNVSLTATTQGAAPVLAANMFAGVTIQGTPGAIYQIQYVNDLASTNWQTITNLAIPRSPYTWTDLQSVTNSKRFYRAVTP